jgi:hypothetical protein
MNRIVLYQQGIDSEFWPDAELAELAGHAQRIEHLRQAEAFIRRHRKRLEAHVDGR